MGFFDWIDQEKRLGNGALTVRAQAVAGSALNSLHHGTFFPRATTPSVRIREITQQVFRQVADRREWNASGRRIVIDSAPIRELEMLPVESTYRIEERELQFLGEAGVGNAAMRDTLRVSVENRVQSLVQANLNRLEVDAFRAWATGTIVVKNPEGAAVDATVSLGFAGSRYANASSAWAGGSGAAWNGFILGLQAARDLFGAMPIGCVLRSATFEAIRADAPIQVGVPGAYMTHTALEEMVGRETGATFKFSVFENTLDIFNDGGADRTATKLWPAQTVAYVPPSGVIGSTYYAPVYTAQDLAQLAGNNVLALDDQVVIRTVENEGRSLAVRCQANALPLPSETSIYVVHTTGV